MCVLCVCVQRARLKARMEEVRAVKANIENETRSEFESVRRAFPRTSCQLLLPPPHRLRAVVVIVVVRVQCSRTNAALTQLFATALYADSTLCLSPLR